MYLKQYMTSTTSKQLFVINEIEELLPTLPGYKKSFHLKYLYYIHIILYSLTYRKLQFKDFVPVNQALMSELACGGDQPTYYHIRNFLINNNIIEVYKRKLYNKKTVESYAVGQCSKKYRICRRFRYSITTKTFDNKFFTKLHQKRKTKLNKLLLNDPDAFRMYLQFKHLKIDETVALEYLEQKRIKFGIDIFTQQQYNHNLLFVNTFNNAEESFFTWENVSKRHYTQLTNLQKEYRKFIYFDYDSIHNLDDQLLIGILHNPQLSNIYQDFLNGIQQYKLTERNNNIENSSNDNIKVINATKLVNIDIKNSQPLLFNIILNEVVKSFKFNDFNSLYINNKYNINKYNNTYNTYVVGFESRNSTEIQDKFKLEVTRYRNLTETGELYEYLMKKYNVTDDRSKFKIDLLSHTFFSKLYKGYDYKDELIFMQEFPLIYLLMCHLKHDDYKYLSVTLQNIESDLVIRDVCKQINSECPYIMLATIHDSIICEEPYQEIVYDYMINKFNELGLNPTLKIEQL